MEDWVPGARSALPRPSPAVTLRPAAAPPVAAALLGIQEASGQLPVRDHVGREGESALQELLFVKQQVERLADGQALLQAAVNLVHQDVGRLLDSHPKQLLRPNHTDSRQPSIASNHDLGLQLNGIQSDVHLDRPEIPLRKDTASPPRKSASSSHMGLAQERPRKSTSSINMGLVQERLQNVHTKSEPLRNSRLNCLTAMAETELRQVFQLNCNAKAMQRRRSVEAVEKLGRAASSSSLRSLVKTWESKRIDVLFDAIASVILLLNAIILGLSMDTQTPHIGPLPLFDCIFAVIFWSELLCKLRAFGWFIVYTGSDWLSNCFDTVLIVVDTAHLCLLLVFQSDKVMMIGENASLLRLVRLIRLVRVVRVLKSPLFQDLLDMIHGLRGGFVTLGWSVVLFVLCIYVVSLVFRTGLGPHTPGNMHTEMDARAMVEKYFQSVPRAMLTVFRCSFGDCSTDQGTPIFEHVAETYGWFWSFVYAQFLFLLVIGLFNVISSIFVQATLESSTTIAAQDKQARLLDQTRWATNFVALLQPLLLHTNCECASLQDLDFIKNGKCTDGMLNEILVAEIPRDVFQMVLEQNDDARLALTRLDIEIVDYGHLADLLDPDNNGTVGVLELLHGLSRLRGDPCRSDIIAVDLMVRSLQEKIDDVWRWMRDSRPSFSEEAATPVQSAWTTALDEETARAQLTWSRLGS